MAQNRQVLGVEGMLSGAELAHELPFGEEECDLRFVDNQLCVGRQIVVRIFVGVDNLPALGAP